MEAEVDVYPSDLHAFDMLKPNQDISKEAIRKFEEHFEYALRHYFAENGSATERCLDANERFWQ